MSKQDDSAKQGIASRDILLATLGFYKVAYETGVSKLKELSEKREEQMQTLVVRGEELEVQAKAKFEELKASDSRFSQGFANLQDNYDKLADMFAAKDEEPVKTVKKVAAPKKKAAKRVTKKAA